MISTHTEATTATTMIGIGIYDPGSRFADPPNGIPPTHPLCDCAHFLHMRAPNPSSVPRIASQRRPIRVTVQILLARFTREAAKAVNCHEDRIPNTPDPCDCGHFPKKNYSDMRVLNKATVTRTAFPDRPDRCVAHCNLMAVAPKAQLSRR